MKIVNPKMETRLSNATCPYCHTKIDESNSTKEHAIGRKFVPKDSLDSQWNLIIRACRKCNHEKGLLENDLSVISMWPSPTVTELDERLVEEIQRKGTAKSVRTGKWVRESEESSTVKAEVMQGCKASFGFTGPPQADRDRVAKLAWFHISVFFYMITYDKAKRIGYPIPGGLAFVGAVGKSDWGNPQIIGFQNMIASWDSRVHCVSADGYFRLVIKRQPGLDENTPLWSWAVEWNKGLRIFGFFGDHEQVQQSVDKLPILQMKLGEQSVDPEKGPYTLRYREETSLLHANDRLFEFNES
tara:strand:+ start:12925 stop:13824 length:900 start_codon:yes stop_codon:yes gene_type:complete